MIAAKLDRLFRSARDALNVVERLRVRSVKLHLLDLGGDIAGNGLSKLLLTIAAAFAEAERDRIRERVGQMKADQRARGRYLGGKVPFGYRRGSAGELVPHGASKRRFGALGRDRIRGYSPCGLLERPTDPFGSMEDAKSPTIRDKVWDWYQGTVYNRLQPNGAIILMNHRMHEDDLSGRLIEQMKAGKDQWTIIELPAIALDNDQLRRQKGEPLWPSQFPLEALARRRDNTLARYWSALYMQNPVPEEGELFSPDRIGVKATAEDVFMWVRAWDLAGSVEGDWTVGVLMGKTRKGSYVVGDVVRFRGRPDTVTDRINETARMDTVRIKIRPPSTWPMIGVAMSVTSWPPMNIS